MNCSDKTRHLVNVIVIFVIIRGTLYLSTLCLGLGENPLHLANANLADIYNLALKKKIKLPHQHYANYDMVLETKPDWSKIPNQRPHRCIPKKTKDFRFLTMHNSLKIGRQLCHIPDIDPLKIKCHNCDEDENNILHLMIFCPATNKAWTHVHDKWQLLIGSYEDFVDEDLEIKQFHKLFGIETQTKPHHGNPTAWNKFMLMHTLDIMLGNMQYVIIKQLKQYLFDTKKPNEDESIHTFDQCMSESINKIYSRMKRPAYKQQWIFTRPKGYLEYTTKTSWFKALDELLRVTLKQSTTENFNFNDAIELTSDLEQEDDVNIHV